MKGEGVLVVVARSCARVLGQVWRGAKKNSYVRIFASPPPRARRPSIKNSAPLAAAYSNSRPDAYEPQPLPLYYTPYNSL
jgi:hypothetical protein